MILNGIAEAVVARRNVLPGAGAVLAAAGLGALAGQSTAAPASTASKSTRRLDFDRPYDNLHAFAKTFGSFSESPVYPTFRGVCFGGVGDAAFRPLFGYEGFTTLRMDLLPSGNVRWWGKEIAFYTDLATGMPLQIWKNPFNGETCEVMHFLNSRQLVELSDELPQITFADSPSESAGTPRSQPAPALRADTSSATGAVARGGEFVLPWLVQDDMVQLTLEHPLR